jgi:hypothetical protein
MEKEYTVKLSKKDIQVILEGLLFASSEDVCLHSYKEDVDYISNLAITLRQQFQNVPVTNAYTISNDNLWSTSNLSKKYTEYFPELLLN